MLLMGMVVLLLLEIEKEDIVVGTDDVFFMVRKEF